VCWTYVPLLAAGASEARSDEPRDTEGEDAKQNGGDCKSQREAENEQHAASEKRHEKDRRGETHVAKARGETGLGT
jgi:hypothetical protein